METTGRFELPLIMPSQAQKHVTHNEALTLIDGLCHLVIKTFGETVPPVSANTDDAFVVGTGASGAWFGESGNIAFNTDTGWRFLTPRQGVIALYAATARLLVYDQNIWKPLGDAIDIASLATLGINTSADTTNRLALRSNAALMTAINSGDGGNGDIQLKLNKETLADTATLVYQSGFSGRAEMGLAGNDDFSIKVSTNGSVWTDALTISATSGAVTLANNSISNAAMADMATARLKGRSSAGTGDPQDLTGAQATALLDLFSTAAKGLAPASGGGTVNYLRADGTWATPASGGGSAAWGGITGTLSTQLDLQSALDAKQVAGSYAAETHAHAIADVTGLQTALNGKQASGSYALATHGHVASEISDFAEGVDDRVATLLTAGTNISLNYNDATNTLTIAAAGAGGGGDVGTGSARFYAFTDCLAVTNTLEWVHTVSGTGAAHTIVDYADANSIGAAQLALGTVATNRGSIAAPTFTTFQLGQGIAKWAARLRLLTLSDATNTWTLRNGFIDSITAESVDGVFFRYTNGVNAGKFQAVTRSNSVETAVDTGITAVTNTNYKFEIEVDATGANAVFKINGSLVATIATNISTATGRETGYGLLVIRSVGTAAVNAYQVDYLMADLSFSIAR